MPGLKSLSWKISSALTIGLALTQTAYAGGVSNASIASTTEQPGTANGGYVFFVDFSSSVVGSPACASANNRFAIDPSTPGGKATIAAILAAQMAGHTITVYGRGACDFWPDTESVNYIIVN